MPRNKSLTIRSSLIRKRWISLGIGITAEWHPRRSSPGADSAQSDGSPRHRFRHGPSGISARDGRTDRQNPGRSLARGDAVEAPPPEIPLGVPSQLLERRPDIAMAERQMAAANEQIGIAQSAFFPDLLITATGGLSAGSIVNWFTWPSRYWAVGPQVSQTVLMRAEGALR